MSKAVRVTDTCQGYCDDLETTVVAEFLEADNNRNQVFHNNLYICAATARATAPCGNKIAFSEGSPRTFINNEAAIRNTDIGYCESCGNTFSIITYAEYLNLD